MERALADRVHEGEEIVRELRDAVGVVGRGAPGGLAGRVAATAQVRRIGVVTRREALEDGLPPAPRCEVAVDEHEHVRTRAVLLELGNTAFAQQVGGRRFTPGISARAAL
jgi:hypothetical protein